jgi:hypothetical protein
MSTEEQETRESQPPQEPTTKVRTSWMEWVNPRGMLFAVSTAVFIVLFVVQSVRVASQEARHKSAVEELRTRHADDLDMMRTSASSSLARTLGASLHQIFVMRSQFPEISDRTFQAIATEMANTGDYKLVAVADSSGAIIASSDLTLVGTSISQIPESDSPLVATSSIKDVNAMLGTVWIEVQPETLTSSGK